MDIITLTIDGIPVKAQKGEKVLWATQEVDKGAIVSVRGSDQNPVNNGRG
jgi:hypothetical protein